MKRSIYVLNGPNLNRLGTREPEIYGRDTLDDIERLCRNAAGDWGVEFRQTNFEGQLVEWVQEATETAAGIVINPAAYSFTSLALLDALKMFPGPIMEVHLSNIHRREKQYHHSYVSLIATGVIAGLGAQGYRLAIAALLPLLTPQDNSG